MKGLVFRLVALLLLASCTGGPPDYPPTVAERPAEIDWLREIEERVPVLTHDRGERWPLILWARLDDPDLSEAQVRMLLARGIVPALKVTAEAVPQARVLQAAGAPVILMQGRSGPWAYGMAGDWDGGVPSIADIAGWRAAADDIRTTMATFRDAGVTVDAAWLDYEVAPSRIGHREAVAADTEDVLPETVRESPSAYVQYRRRLFVSLMSAYVAGPLREVFPRISVTNWMTVLSTADRPVPGMVGGHLPPSGIGLFTATNPVAYGTDAGFLALVSDRDPDRETTDRAYLHLLLRQVSADAANRREVAPEVAALPWVARWVPLVARPPSTAGGLGIRISWDGTGVRVEAVRPGMPAAAAGLQAGDRIVAVAGADLAGETLESAVARLRGPVGESVSLRVERLGTLDIVRAALVPPVPMMSRTAYREALRHIWLRGVDGLQVFTSTTPGDAETVIGELLDARAVYDEMLAHRDILEYGTPLNLDIPAPDDGLIWSGLATGTAALVRVTSLGSWRRTVRVVPWPGAGVELDVRAPGAGYLLTRAADGAVAVRPLTDGPDP